jgi:hypothetical protein
MVTQRFQFGEKFSPTSNPLPALPLNSDEDMR